MTWLLILGSSLAYEIIASSAFTRIIPAQWLPNVVLLWIYVLADRTPQTAARANDVWLSGLAGAAALGYITDVFQVAPRGLHVALYLVAFIIVRIATDRLTKAHPLRLFLTIGVTTFAVQAAIWYTKALLQRFKTLSALDPTAFVIHATITAAFALLVFPLMARAFDDEQQARL